MKGFIETSISSIRNVGSSSAIVGVSGGVDSTVAAVLVHKAIGDRLKPVMVDHGLMREDEVEFVVSSFKSLGIKVKVVDAAARFISKLAGVCDPEDKRKIIGEEFIRVFEKEAVYYEDAGFLVQGTILSDVIESGTEGKDKKLVKSHHNVGGLPEQMNLRLLEPMRSVQRRSMGCG